MCNEYNGWKNYQSWNMALWIDNDQGLYETVRETVQGMKPHEAEDWLKEFMGDMNPLADQANMYSDLLGHALACVDYQEIIKHYQEEE
jgi:hypothetical protein